MSEISLTASMRSNLLSLQQIAKLQDSTQLRLSTGLKVNSAIDNPSSYYTASSLNNRAEDLSALLDSMGQSVQTIKAATEGIEKAEDLLSQMKAIAEQVNTGVYVPEKSYFEEKVGANGAVVTNAEELRAAVDSGKEEICVYGKIDLGDISTSGGLNLQENQKLVGVNYYGNFGTEGEEFSSISATSSAAKNMIDITKTGCLVSDLNLNYENSANGSSSVINTSNKDIVLDIQNLDINAKFSEAEGYNRAAIGTWNGSTINMEGSFNFNISGNRGYGIYGQTNSLININSKTFIQINTSGKFGYGILTTGFMSVEKNANIDINTTGYDAECLRINLGASCDIAGNLKLTTEQGYPIYLYGETNTLNLLSSSTLYLKSRGIDIAFSEKEQFVNIAKGAKVAIEKNGQIKWYETKKVAELSSQDITVNNIEKSLDVVTTSSWQTPADILEQEKAAQAEKETEEQANRVAYQKQFNNALLQYDSLIKDSSYKGVNLLQADDLKVIFNENRSATLDVMGVDLSSDKIGLMTADWLTAEDVQKTIEQLSNAKNSLRSAATKLGNYYSIITERETFTNNLINVLEEGADKLTLADMNEESANMLSLQTRQQLAINSLSLASQASQAVLRLF